MLGICFFTWRGEYTGEPVWEGEKGVLLQALPKLDNHKVDSYPWYIITLNNPIASIKITNLTDKQPSLDDPSPLPISFFFGLQVVGLQIINHHLSTSHFPS